jgi:DNA-binding MarR family transcriptional regulator
MPHLPDELVQWSLELSRSLRRKMESDCSEVNVLRLHALGIIGDHQELTMSQFARAMSISPSSATEFVDRLETCGLVRRVLHPTNRRSVFLALTRKGTEVIRSGMRLKAHHLGSMFATLSTTDRSHLQRIFRILLQKHPISPSPTLS